ncbi:hypothetical protein FS842_005693 [Serendipita sp. 407]|nr:hypothetical protein FS842_005693 [Serendipita sp. 407]
MIPAYHSQSQHLSPYSCVCIYKDLGVRRDHVHSFNKNPPALNDQHPTTLNDQNPTVLDMLGYMEQTIKQADSKANSPKRRLFFDRLFSYKSNSQSKQAQVGSSAHTGGKSSAMHRRGASGGSIVRTFSGHSWSDHSSGGSGGGACDNGRQ